jgi:FKBP-type peptidyl-prolyl cis-trans isomerase FkpA
MATPKSQRIGIWIIAIVLTIGTLGSFLAIVLGNQNKQTDQANLQKASTEYQKAYTDYQAKSKVYDAQVAAQAKQLSDQYYGIFNQYASSPAKFDASSVKTLKTQDIKIGDGEKITTKTAYSAYYIGWNPKGVIFDQSIDKGALKAPITVTPDGQMIVGWNQGVLGMNINGVRELSIPSSMAYGATGSGDNIPANTPIKFVVMVIPEITVITPVQQPQPPQILIDYYKSQQTGTQ